MKNKKNGTKISGMAVLPKISFVMRSYAAKGLYQKEILRLSRTT